MNLDQVVDRYVKLRDKKKEMEEAHKASLRPINEAMERLEVALLTHLEQNGTEAVRTKAGTAYKKTETSITIADKEVFKNHLFETGRWDLADIRASKTGIEAYREENDDLPPGVNWRQSLSVGIQRA